MESLFSFPEGTQPLIAAVSVLYSAYRLIVTVLVSGVKFESWTNQLLRLFSLLFLWLREWPNAAPGRHAAWRPKIDNITVILTLSFRVATKGMTFQALEDSLYGPNSVR